MKQIFINGLIYFVLVFLAGVVLGTVRVLLLVPLVGDSKAELMEMPLMLVVIGLAARYVVGGAAAAGTAMQSLMMGVLALVLLLSVEFTLVLAIRGMSMAQYFAARDPLSGTVYMMMLLLFMVMPLIFWLGRKYHIC